MNNKKITETDNSMPGDADFQGYNLAELFGEIPYPEQKPESKEPEPKEAPLWEQPQEIQINVRDEWALAKCGKPFHECDGYEKTYLRSQGLLMGLIFSIPNEVI